MNVITNTMVKYVKILEIYTKIVSAFLNTQTLKIICTTYICFSCNKIYQKKFEENLKKRSFNV